MYVLDPYLTRYSKGREMYIPAIGVTWDVYRTAAGDDIAQRKGPSLRNAILELEGIIAVIEQLPEEAEVAEASSATANTKNRNIFVAHGKESSALQKLEKFIRALGLNPVIVKDEASRGGGVDDVVDGYMAQCTCAIILATKDDFVDESFQPRSNVIHEIGLAQEKLSNRLIYLKEEGCSFPSNVAPKVWEDFTQENMDDAFIKIAKELRAFGIIS